MIPWMHRVTNEEVLRRAGVDKEIFQMIKRRKTVYFGHLLRGEKYELLRLLIREKLMGKAQRMKKAVMVAEHKTLNRDT